MADSTQPHTPRRDFGAAAQLATIVATDLRRHVLSRKTIALAIVQLIPVLIALIYVFFEDVDGLAMFSETVEGVIFPLLLPLAALFYGGPALVDEVEGRTLTYLTLRPIARPALFVGKWLAGAILATGVVLIPILLLLAISVAAAGEFEANPGTIVQILAAAAAGCAAFTAIFAALGAAFARSLMGSIVYFVVVEVMVSKVPTLELLSLRFQMNAAAGLAQVERGDLLASIGVADPIALSWWQGLSLIIFYLALGLICGALVFTRKQYHV